MTRRFTGYHMAAILIAFFAVVVAVNMVMAVLASRTFGGTVVDNSYVASQRFNRWLAAAREQDSSGWALKVTLDPARHATVVSLLQGSVVTGARVTGFAEHPLGRAADVPLTFAEIAPGGYRSDAALPTGRWIIHVTVRSLNSQAQTSEEVL